MKAALAAASLIAIAVAPLLSHKGVWLSLLCQIGIAAIFALSFNLLLGQTGLLSFGHAVYFGVGAFATMHLLRAIHSRGVRFPVTLLPLVGGLAALTFAAAAGYWMTRRAGTTFAMISLGIGELVASSSLMFPALFGGEAGLSSDRSTGAGWFGIDYGSPLQMYYLIAGWALLCGVAMYLFTDTPLGRMANAVRDNPERAAFVGYDPRQVRFLMVMLAGLFAGIAGGLSALNYEIVTAEALSAATSGLVIMMAFVGGLGFFAGPILGAALITTLQIAIAPVTEAWPFYFGLLFTALVLWSPGGVAGLFRARGSLRALPVILLCAAGLIGLVELTYAAAHGEAGRPLYWSAAVALLASGALLSRRKVRA
jgi:branched-chain amino acid transport system permease protein